MIKEIFFKTKVVRIGKSLGIVFPKEIIEKENLKMGNMVQVKIIRKVNK